MRGKTLAEKKYGPGIRPGLLRQVDAPVVTCAAETSTGHPCTTPVAGSIEVYVDAKPPGVDWYSRLLRTLPPDSWVRLRFCLQHLEAVSQRSVLAQEEPDSWEPGRENPFVLINPPKVWTPDAS